MKTLRIGDKVIRRGNRGHDDPQVATVVNIESNCTNKQGTPIKRISWNTIKSAKIIVDLDNGHWAYGFQLRPYHGGQGNETQGRLTGNIPAQPVG